MRCRSTSLMGTTSACAENTCRNPQNAFLDWNYLRVRGEYWGNPPPPWWQEELPPRARRIKQRGQLAASEIGTTSACAENTARCPTGGHVPWNYLRVRGEYSTEVDSISSPRELPPRARRIRLLALTLGIILRTTSACAENTRGRHHYHRG